MSNEEGLEPDPRAIIQSLQKTIPSNKTQPCCLIKSCSIRNEPVKMVEQDIYEFYKKRLTNLTEHNLKLKDCKCKRFEPYTTCVNDKKTLQEQKRQDKARENYLKTKRLLEQTSHSFKPKEKKAREVIELEQPAGGEKVPLKLASPSCSRETFYKPTRKLVGLHFL